MELIEVDKFTPVYCLFMLCSFHCISIIICCVTCICVNIAVSGTFIV